MNKKILIVVGITILFLGLAIQPSIAIINNRDNNPPYAPSNYYLCGETDVHVNIYLSWDGGDPDPGDTVTYDVYLGFDPDPPLVATIGPYPWNQKRMEYDPGTLVYGAIYHMKIVAWDNHGTATVGPECWFTTRFPLESPLINGSRSGEAGVEYDYTFVSYDFSGDDLFYFIVWDDGTDTGWVGPCYPGEVITLSHSWSENGIYDIKAKVKNYWDEESSWSFLSISIGNHPPDAPTITGPTQGKPGINLTFVFYAEDSDGDDVSYYVEWGDGTTTGWTDYLSSGDNFVISHKWSNMDHYPIRCKAKDIYNAEGDWSNYSIFIPRNKIFDSNLYLLERLLEKFPFLEVFLRIMNL